MGFKISYYKLETPTVARNCENGMAHAATYIAGTLEVDRQNILHRHGLLT